MNRILKIHGCSGAGKTTAVRGVLDYYNMHPLVYPTADKTEAYVDPSNTIYVLGNYANACGGMDTVGTAEEVMKLLEKYEKLGHVIFEGLLQSTYYGAMGVHSQQYKDRYIYAFLDTPVELCLERVVARRAASGRNNKFNPQLTRDKHATIEALKSKLIRGGVGFYHEVVTLKHDGDLVQQITELLK